MRMVAWLARAAFLLPGLMLAISAAACLQSGLAFNSAFPVPNYIEMNYVLPATAYREAADRLAGTDPRDAGTKIFQSEALADSGASSQAVLAILYPAMRASPSSARGWTLLCEQLEPRDRAGAANALEMALALGSFDYWMVGRRVRDASQIWDNLSQDGRDNALMQTRILWTEPLLRPEIANLVQTQAGRTLLQRAFEAEPETVREINRWSAALRRGEERL
jgi:hypothetical protein